MAAVLTAARRAPGNTNLNIETDSKFMINKVTANLRKREDTGYIGSTNWDLTRKTVAGLQRRPTQIQFTWVKGHNRHIRNKGADRLAGEAARKTNHNNIDLNINPSAKISEAKLRKMTQQLACHAIREKKAEHYKKRLQAKST
jgi:ribonuclease HI